MGFLMYNIFSLFYIMRLVFVEGRSVSSFPDYLLYYPNQHETKLSLNNPRDSWMSEKPLYWLDPGDYKG